MEYNYSKVFFLSVIPLRTTMKKQSTDHSFVEIHRNPAQCGTELQSWRSKSLYGWWLSQAAHPPLRRDFDIIEHRKIASHLFLIEVHGPERFLIKLVGEGAAHILGRNNSGQWASNSPDNPHGALIDYYLRLCESRIPWHCHGRLTYLGREHIRFESIDCPLAGEDGSITHIIGCIDLL